MLKLAVAAGSAALLLVGCASLPGNDPTSQLPEQVLDNLKHCKRTYQASLGGLGVPGGSLFIECPAEPYPSVAPSE